jgi:hypothetical protein
MEDTNRIKFALHLGNWNYETGDKKYLHQHAVKVTTTEYTLDMRGNIYCPECCVGLFRSPEDKEYNSSGRKAFFAHSRRYKPECSLRVSKAEGKRFENEEQAKRAVENEELVIVKGFMKEKPLLPDIDGPGKYQGSPIEDQDGGMSAVPIGRHNGEEFKLPSKITTIRGLCRNFERNLHRYFFLPDQSHALILQDLLTNIENVTETCDKSKIYFGKVNNSYNCGSTSKNIRQTMFAYKRRDKCADFCLKATDEDSREHGIDDDSNGKIVLMYGKVTGSGIGLCIEHLGWGEFAVLPSKYAHLLYENT